MNNERMTYGERLSVGILKKAGSQQDAVSIYELLFNESGENTVLARTVEDIQRQLEFFKVFELDGSVVGCASCEIYSNIHGMAEIRSVVVDENYRGIRINGQTIGAQLVRECINDSISKGVRSVFVTTNRPGYFMRHFNFKREKEGEKIYWKKPNWFRESEMYLSQEDSVGEIRLAQEWDITSISQLIRVESAKGNVIPRDEDNIAQDIDGFFVCQFDNQIIACVNCRIYSPRIAEVLSLVVDEKYRRQGIGSRLLLKCHEYLEENNILQAFLTANNDYALKHGFTIDQTGKQVLWLRRDTG